jgi:hypothetical protein
MSYRFSLIALQSVLTKKTIMFPIIIQHDVIAEWTGFSIEVKKFSWEAEMKAVFIASFLSCLLITTTTYSGERAWTDATIGQSAYAHEWFPECTHGIDLETITKTAATISSFLGYSDAGLVRMGGEIIGEVRRHGGALSEWLSELEGGSKSACVTICVAPPEGHELNWGNFFIDGKGCIGDGTDAYPRPGASGEWLECGKGWAGLRKYSVTSAGACAVFANWKHDWQRGVSVIIDYD